VLRQLQRSRLNLRAEAKDPNSIHLLGVLLFLFIPLVLYLLLKLPFGVGPSLGIALLIMGGHRFVVGNFVRRYSRERCFWCGRTGKQRQRLTVSSGTSNGNGNENGNSKNGTMFEFCVDRCTAKAKRFFYFCNRYKDYIRAGIFGPLIFYALTVPLFLINKPIVPMEWETFVFRFFIACTVVAVSFFPIKGESQRSLSFPFPAQNLLLLGIQNTLFVFRYVGIWWILASLYFLFTLPTVQNLLH
jgi:hypothetical protein